MKSSWIRIGVPSLLVLFLASSLAQAQQMYLMTRLGFSPTSPTINGANGINNNGDVVGYDSAINGAYLLHNGVVSSLGMTSASGVAISITGHVALRSWGPDLHSYLFTPGRRIWFNPFTDLGTLGGTGGLNNTGQTVALGMNDNRTIVGQSTVSTTPQTWHAFSWSAGHMTDLGALSPGGTSSANAINNLGQIVGDSFGTDGIDRAFTMVNGVMTDLDPATHNYDSTAVAINDTGQIVVVSNLVWQVVPVGRFGFKIMAFPGPTYYTQIYSNGVFTNIGSLSYAGDIWGYSINSAGDVVGAAVDSTINRSHAFLYHAGTMTALDDVVTNLSGWRVSIATRINDLGEIACWVRNNTTNELQAAILTPILD